ncbi:MAG: AAA family ATPase [Oscillospiraceae bacterium]|nr:AAA family ATPase [Oscillospiraceae bacterium]
MNDTMKYNCGMYGGSFNPLHLGHIRCIIEAANQCRILIIVLSHGTNRNEIDVRVRYRWLYTLTKHLPNIRLFVMSDDAGTKSAYTEDYWEEDAAKVKKFAGEKIDAVFCGSDYDENSFWGKCYPDAQLIIIQRNGISSTQIRNDIYAHWDWIPQTVRPYFVKKVLLIGGESTGKSTLSINLAEYYNTNYLEEVGRDISERSGTDTMMLPGDFTDILLEHKMREKQAAALSNKILFEDTDCLITLFFLGFLEGKDKERNADLAAAISQLNSYDLILFLEPDVEFVQDGDRSEIIAADRSKYSEEIKAIYRKYDFKFQTVSGSYQERFLKATELVDKMIAKERQL